MDKELYLLMVYIPCEGWHVREHHSTEGDAFGAVDDQILNCEEWMVVKLLKQPEVTGV